MEGEGKGDGHQYGRKPRTPEPIPIAGKVETHLVRKRWDIGLLRALSLWIMMIMMIYKYLSGAGEVFKYTYPAPEKPGNYLKIPLRRRRRIYTHFSAPEKC